MKNSQTITKVKNMTFKRLEEIAKVVERNITICEGLGVEKIDCTLEELFKMSDEIFAANKTTKYFWIMDSVQNRLFKLLNMII